MWNLIVFIKIEYFVHIKLHLSPTKFIHLLNEQFASIAWHTVRNFYRVTKLPDFTNKSIINISFTYLVNQNQQFDKYSVCKRMFFISWKPHHNTINILLWYQLPVVDMFEGLSYKCILGVFIGAMHILFIWFIPP